MTAEGLGGFSLTRLPPWHPLQALKQQLLFNGRQLGIHVNGDDIEHVLALDSFHVIATVYDYFDACNHWIYLLDEHMELKDAVTMPNYFGFLQDVEHHGQDQISFSYYGTHDRWRLKVDKLGQWRYSLGDLLLRPNRFLPRKRHMMLNCVKGPKWQGEPDSSDKS